jgi:acetyltransferase
VNTQAGARYPVEWIDRFTLKDGRLVTIRPVLPQDDSLERAFVAQGMTAKSRYLRFLIGMHELPDALAQSFTNIDYHHHFALLAEWFDDGRQVQIGDARFVREDPQSGSAEFAMAIADAWQGFGLGQHLLQLIVKAAHAHGVTLLYGDVLHENTSMLALAARNGFSLRRHPDDARLARVQRDLRVDAPVEGDDATRAVLAHAMAQPREAGVPH